MTLLVIVPGQEVWTCKWGFIPKLYITNNFYWNIWIANEKVYALKSQWNSQQFRHDERLDQENLQENWKEKTNEKAVLKTLLWFSFQMNSQDKHIPKSIWLALMYPKVMMKYIVKVNMKRILRKDKLSWIYILNILRNMNIHYLAKVMI